jgi:7-cyano-7-deazaguanine synthase in queuosine biosynthesis
MNVDINLNGVRLPFIVFPGPNGVSVSGGADSAILLYILMNHTIDPIHIFTAALKTKNNVAPRFALQVIEKCIDLTGNSNVFHHIHFINDMSRNGNLFNGHNFFLKNNLISRVYTGETLLPPRIEFEKFKNQDYFMYNQRDPINKKPIIDGKFYSPFRHIDKKQIKDLYLKYDVLETLFPVTRSCESTTLTEGHCGECLWCEERFWAFNRYH